MTSLSPTTGFSIPSADDIRASLVARLQAVYGVDCDLSVGTPDGDALTAYAEAARELWQAGEDIYNAADPNSAAGQALFRLGAFCGITWKVGTKGTILVTLHVSAGQTIPAGTKLQDTVTKVEYALNTDVGPAGANAPPEGQAFTTTATAVLEGQPLSTAGTPMVPSVPVYGLLSVNDLWSDGMPGCPAETQAKFRVRRARSVAMPAQGMTDGLWAGLAALPGIGRVRTHENRKSEWADIQPGDAALPPHSVAVVVDNDVAGIGDVIHRRAGQGLTLVGSSTAVVLDSQGVGQAMRYTVAAPFPIAVTMTYRALAGQGFDGTARSANEALVKAALSAWVETIDFGGTVNLFDLPAVILAAVVGPSGGRAIEIETLLVGPVGGDMTAANVGIPWNRQATLALADVTLTAV